MSNLSLYIKRCSHCTLLYFGVSSSEHVSAYIGSGRYWLRHLQKHGATAVHLKSRSFKSPAACARAAAKFSKRYDIVNSVDSSGRKLWANLMPETGVLGGGSAPGRTGKTYYTDGVSCRLLNPKDEDDAALIRKQRLQPGKSYGSNAGCHSYTDGVHSWWLDPDDEAHKAFIERYSLTKGNAKMKGLRYFNDGHRSFKLHPVLDRATIAANGLVQGISKSSATGKGTIYTDGVRNFRLDPSNPKHRKRIKAENLSVGGVYESVNRCWYNDGERRYLLDPTTEEATRLIKRKRLVQGNLSLGGRLLYHDAAGKRFRLDPNSQKDLRMIRTLQLVAGNPSMAAKKWFNNGVRNFRLDPVSDRKFIRTTTGLMPGRL